MKFVYQYRTPDNKQHRGVIKAASKEAAYSSLKAQGIKPGRVEEAPGFFNKLFGKGKRWIAIGVLSAACVVLCFAFFGKARTPNASIPSSFDAAIDSMTRRQPIGDSAIIEQGIKTGWSNVFESEGERFLASFAIPGVPAGQRNTTEEEILKALNREGRATSSTGDTLETRQIVAMVEGMKRELREFIADGGTVVEYGKLLVRRQEQEIGYYNRAKGELESAQKSGMPESALMELWAKRNGKLRRMGIKLVPMPE